MTVILDMGLRAWGGQSKDIKSKDMDIKKMDQTMTSLEIAEYSGKQHKHVLEAIRTMEPAWAKVAGSKFRLGTYVDANQQDRPCYKLTKSECLFIATKFNDIARAKLVLRWEELEQKQSIDFSDPKNVLQVVQRWVESEEQRKILEVQNELQAKQLKEAAPKVDYYDKVIQSDEAIRTTVIAKDLGMSAKKLNRLLYLMGVQYKVGKTWVLYAKYADKGYTVSLTHPYTGSDGSIKTRIQTCWTQKGREFVMKAVEAYRSRPLTIQN